MLRRWCLAVLIVLGLLAAADGTAPDAPGTAQGSAHAVGVLTDSPSSDGTSGRHVAATLPIVCPAASTWTSQAHHAVLARAVCHSRLRAPRPDTAFASSFPLALRPQIQTPLLI